ncbi:phosphoenolpyruvate--protein phosphotransferase [Myxococcus llanfairpwllgwyngyllgogerychwyrndrobwllllantysiliogogogochensis]|uniref:phosphoenolpyruvate--protein phosphotransferase n=1 Tax=Myxococcus llanfairpwllgwyngyllgogerychwyrndrobwllllantysiliogogogochensis TaxID=2590453 RepID=A0A540WXG1_9BACT|nr:phosphoenolpyruvate--protein phosphotransferase [Myxococcus llanfairpwllgwyngyllgogerychwyrndrobwllllantysiliogogogochensis]TQF13696.1 phosphoenolpyruvate--protein phosphotransferase [Myxococcus llanfairpwllgwyngyllgogerychwyrndrobwllllantysiliogogogochensis]
MTGLPLKLVTARPSSATLLLSSPLSGWAARLEEVPDPAFAQRLAGDGIVVDPTSAELRAPCDGVVISIHASRHACTLRAETGAEILLHIGIDTVELRGEGFTVHVQTGQKVRTGDVLIGFDLELLARKARSLQTLMLVVNAEGYTVTERVEGRSVSVGEPLLAVTGSAPVAPEGAGEGGATRQVRLLIAHGLHARPAAALAQRARQHAGTVRVACHGRVVNGKSVSALMGLGATHGDLLTLHVEGEAAERVAQELAEWVASGLGDPTTPVAEPVMTARGITPVPVAAPSFLPGKELLLEGIVASPGSAVGRAVRVIDLPVDLPEQGLGVTLEEQRLSEALARVRRELEEAMSATPGNGGARADIFRAHLALLDDPELIEAANRELAAGRGAAWAWRAVVERQAAVLLGLEDARLAERAGDLHDLARRVVAALTGEASSRIPSTLPPEAILVADELLPSELAALEPHRIAGICTARGGPTSHVAILASGMGLPAVVALGNQALGIPEGAPLVLDGDRGEVRVFPSEETREATRRAMTSRAAHRRVHLLTAHEDCRTADGVRIEVLANLGRPGEAVTARDKGAEGCGLLRTEFLFLERVRAPGEDEQLARYQEIADALGGRPVVIRTLDVGGDKPLAYLPLPHEDNPVLGLRGVRVSLREPELLRTQLRAILRVRPVGVCRILVPMISSRAELRAVRALLESEQRALGLTAPILLGAMVEVPAAAVLADQLAAEADFLSIGTNDLTQYVLAVDRGNPHLAARLDGLHPGVLRLVAKTVEGARVHGRPVAVCGGVASEPRAAPLLLGLGVTELSATPSVIPDLKAFIRTLSLARCEQVAREALELESAEAVRALVSSTWPGL